MLGSRFAHLRVQDSDSDSEAENAVASPALNMADELRKSREPLRGQLAESSAPSYLSPGAKHSSDLLRTNIQSLEKAAEAAPTTAAEVMNVHKQRPTAPDDVEVSATPEVAKAYPVEGNRQRRAERSEKKRSGKMDAPTETGTNDTRRERKHEKISIVAPFSSELEQTAKVTPVPIDQSSESALHARNYEEEMRLYEERLRQFQQDASAKDYPVEPCEREEQHNELSGPASITDFGQSIPAADAQTTTATTTTTAPGKGVDGALSTAEAQNLRESQNLEKRKECPPKAAKTPQNDIQTLIDREREARIRTSSSQGKEKSKPLSKEELKKQKSRDEKVKRFLAEKYWEKTYGFDPSKRGMPLFVVEEHCPPKVMRKSKEASPLATVTPAPTTMAVSQTTVPEGTSESHGKHIAEEAVGNVAKTKMEEEEGDDISLDWQVTPDVKSPMLPTGPNEVGDTKSNAPLTESIKSLHSTRSKEQKGVNLPKRSVRSKSGEWSSMVPSEVGVKLAAISKVHSNRDDIPDSQDGMNQLEGVRFTKMTSIPSNHATNVKDSLNNTQRSSHSKDLKGSKLSLGDSMSDAQASRHSKNRKWEGLSNNETPHETPIDLQSRGQRDGRHSNREPAHDTPLSLRSRDIQSEHRSNGTSLNDTKRSQRSKDERGDKLPKRGVHSVKGDIELISVPYGGKDTALGSPTAVSSDKLRSALGDTNYSLGNPLIVEEELTGLARLTVSGLQRYTEELEHPEDPVAHAESSHFQSCVSPKTNLTRGSRRPTNTEETLPMKQSKWADKPPYHQRLLHDMEERKRRERAAMNRSLEEYTFRPNMSRSPTHRRRLPTRAQRLREAAVASRSVSPARGPSARRRPPEEPPLPSFQPTISKFARDAGPSLEPYHKRLYTPRQSAPAPHDGEAFDPAGLSPRLLDAIAAGNADAMGGIHHLELFRPSISPRARTIRNHNPFHERLYPSPSRQHESPGDRSRSRSPAPSPTSPQSRAADDGGYFRPSISPLARAIANSRPFHERLYPDPAETERRRGGTNGESPKRPLPRRSLPVSPRLLERPAPAVDPNPHSFHPQISPRARAAGRRGGPFHERLYPGKEIHQHHVDPRAAGSVYDSYAVRRGRHRSRQRDDDLATREREEGRGRFERHESSQSEPNVEVGLHPKITPQGRNNMQVPAEPSSSGSSIALY